MCVRRLFVLRSVASCVAFVLCWFVWRSCAAAHRVKRLIVDVGASTFGHGNGRFATRGGLSTGQRRTSDRRRTGGHSSDADILRHSKMGGGAAADLPRTRHGLSTDGTWACLRTSDGRATGGLRSDLDKPRRAKMGGGAVADYTRTGNGYATDYTRTCHGLIMDDSPTDGRRASDGQHTDGRRAGGAKDNALPHQSYT